jgi:hypothetical protein
MRAAIGMALLVGVGMVPVAFADEHASLLAAEQELKVARAHLAEAGRRYGGHRAAALEHVNQALEELRQALATAKTGGSTAKPAKPAPPRKDDD